MDWQRRSYTSYVSRPLGFSEIGETSIRDRRSHQWRIRFSRFHPCPSLVRSTRPSQTEFECTNAYVLSHQTIKKDEFYALLSVADLGVITPLRDGMNTTSMEFVLAQEKSKKSPLVLSEFMGISSNMTEALQINPWNLGVSFLFCPVLFFFRRFYQSGVVVPGRVMT